MACCPPRPGGSALATDCAGELPSGSFLDPIGTRRHEMVAAAFRRAAEGIECVPFGHELRSRFSVWWPQWAVVCPNEEASDGLLNLYREKFEDIATEVADGGYCGADSIHGSLIEDVAESVANVPRNLAEAGAKAVDDLTGWSLSGFIASIPWWVWLIVALATLTVTAILLLPLILAAVR